MAGGHRCCYIEMAGRPARDRQGRMKRTDGEPGRKTKTIAQIAANSVQRLGSSSVLTNIYRVPPKYDANVARSTLARKNGSVSGQPSALR